MTAPSLADQLDAAGLSWRGYYQGMPYPSYRATVTRCAASEFPTTTGSYRCRRLRRAVWLHGNDAIVINFDKGDDNAGCCGTNPGGGRALAVVVTNRGPRGLQDPTPYNHYSLLATLEGVAGVRCLAAACDY